MAGIPIIASVLEFFRNRYPSLNPATNLTDMFPANSLETWQCPDITSRSQLSDPHQHFTHHSSDCVTDGTPDIAGLVAVLERALQLPAALVAEYIPAWQTQLDLVPALPLTTADSLAIIAHGALLPPSPSNSENTNLYPVHPFRLFGVGKPNLPLARNTYQTRMFPCNDGVLLIDV